MDGLVNVVKEELVEAARGCKDPNTYQATLDGIPYDLAGSDPAAFDIDLGDFFDVLSGDLSSPLLLYYAAVPFLLRTAAIIFMSPFDSLRFLVCRNKHWFHHCHLSGCSRQGQHRHSEAS